MTEIRTYLQYVNLDELNAENGSVPWKLLMNDAETNRFHMPVASRRRKHCYESPSTETTLARFLWQHSTKTWVKRRFGLLACYIFCKVGATITWKWVGGRRAGWPVVDVEKHGPAASSGPALVLVIQALFNDRKRLKGNLLFIVLPDNRK